MALLNEFDIIDKYFASMKGQRTDTVLGIGDDAAIVDVPADEQLLVATDTIVEGVHFDARWSAEAIGHKALAVNLSDLAAMGGTPRWFTLSLVMPSVDPDFLQGISEGLAALSQAFDIQLVGGDLCRGPLEITITVLGTTPRNQAVQRRGARVGDLICVTGALGLPGLAMQPEPVLTSLNKDERDQCENALFKPHPRVSEGLLLRGWATSMVDISDGLIADLGHILKQSGVGACLQVTDIPIALQLTQVLDAAKARDIAYHHGEDFELCFTIGPEDWDAFKREHDLPCQPIGVIESQPGLRLQTEQGVTSIDETHGFQHFSKT
jgi:thiamine-monophosphate kinase